MSEKPKNWNKKKRDKKRSISSDGTVSLDATALPTAEELERELQRRAPKQTEALEVHKVQHVPESSFGPDEPQDRMERQFLRVAHAAHRELRQEDTPKPKTVWSNFDPTSAPFSDRRRESNTLRQFNDPSITPGSFNESEMLRAHVERNRQLRNRERELPKQEEPIAQSLPENKNIVSDELAKKTADNSEKIESQHESAQSGDVLEKRFKQLRSAQDIKSEGGLWYRRQIYSNDEYVKIIRHIRFGFNLNTVLSNEMSAIVEAHIKFQKHLDSLEAKGIETVTPEELEALDKSAQRLQELKSAFEHKEDAPSSSTPEQEASKTAKSQESISSYEEFERLKNEFDVRENGYHWYVQKLGGFIDFSKVFTYLQLNAKHAQAQFSQKFLRLIGAQIALHILVDDVKKKNDEGEAFAPEDALRIKEFTKLILQARADLEQEGGAEDARNEFLRMQDMANSPIPEDNVMPDDVPEAVSAKLIPVPAAFQETSKVEVSLGLPIDQVQGQVPEDIQLKAYEERVAIRNVWKEKKTLYETNYEAYLNEVKERKDSQSVFQKMAFWRKENIPESVRQSQAEYEEARRAYATSLSSALLGRAERVAQDEGKEEKIEGLRAGLANRFVLKAAHDRLALERQFVPEGRALQVFSDLQKTLKKHRTLIRAAGYATVAGVALVSGGIGAAVIALGTKTLQTKVSAVLTAAGATGGAYLGNRISESVINVREKRRNSALKDAQFSFSVERLDALEESYLKRYRSHENAVRNKKYVIGAGAIAGGILGAVAAQNFHDVTTVLQPPVAPHIPVPAPEITPAPEISTPVPEVPSEPLLSHEQLEHQLDLPPNEGPSPIETIPATPVPVPQPGVEHPDISSITHGYGQGSVEHHSGANIQTPQEAMQNVPYTFKPGSKVDTVSEALFESWKQDPSLLETGVTKKEFLTQMYGAMSQIEKNPSLNHDLLDRMGITSGDLDKVQVGQTINLQPFFEYLKTKH